MYILTQDNEKNIIFNCNLNEHNYCITISFKYSLYT